MKTRFIFLRHGLTENNMQGLFLGKTDVGLSKLGHAQVLQTGLWLSKNESIDVIVSSHLKRALVSAEGIGLLTGAKVMMSHGLHEMDFGDWEGKSHVAIAQADPNAYARWENTPHMHRIPKAEKLQALHKRVLQTIGEVHRAFEGKTICVVTHAVCLRVLLHHLKGHPLHSLGKTAWPSNMSISMLDLQNKSAIFMMENFDGHLHESLRWNPYQKLTEKICV